MLGWRFNKILDFLQNSPERNPALFFKLENRVSFQLKEGVSLCPASGLGGLLSGKWKEVLGREVANSAQGDLCNLARKFNYSSPGPVGGKVWSGLRLWITDC